MNERRQKSTWPFAQIWTSRLRSQAFAAILAASLCCISIPVGALADENPPEAPNLSDEAQSSESSESAGLDAGDDTEANDGQNTGNDSSASEIPSDNADASVDPDTETPAEENSTDEEEPNTTPSAEMELEEEDLYEDEDEDDDDFIEESRESSKSVLIKNSDDDEANLDGTVEGKQKTQEEEALDKLAQARAIYDHMNRLASEINELQARYDELEAINGKALSRHKKMKESLEREQKKLSELKGEMSSHVVKMYKQGGVTPYLDVLCGAASYKEFLSLWYMLDKVTHFGEREFYEQAEAVKELEAEMSEVDEWVESAEKEANEARVKLNRSRLTYLSLAPHAASLRMEAAAMLGENANVASAQAEYDSAYAELNSALDQGLAEGSRLEGEGVFTNPCPDAVYSSGFGYRSFDNAYHLGLDMAIGEGTPYYAADDGVVINATNGGGYNGGAGNWIVIDHGNGVVTKYMHSAVTFVSPGETVVRGQNIGLVGNTGKSFGSHLHFQVEIDGVAVDPLIYL